jgi:hypothetical protein
MHNPWAELPSQPPFVLPSDRLAIDEFNASADGLHKIRTEVLPEPFLGPLDTKVVLLNLNPGFDDRDQSLYEQSCGRAAWQKNIRHQPLDYPFYLLDPQFKAWPGPRWWLRKLKEPIEISNVKTVANQICCIEHFPYHSTKYKDIPGVLDSQKYSFYLVERAIDRNAIIILMRGEKLWCEAVPRLGSHNNLFRLNSHQNVAISRNNCPMGFPAIEQILLANLQPETCD